MGSKHGKSKEEKQSVVAKSPELTEADYQFLEHQTNHSRAEIKAIFELFSNDNRDLKLDKKEFCRLYIQLRPERADTLDEISEFVFNAFDTDHNGSVDFNEFMVCLR
jgi:Ca2+-binding EF-hand superfamily protein